MDPVRDPQSQALIFPPDDPGIDTLRSEIADLKAFNRDILQLVEYMLDSDPYLVGRDFLELIRKKYNIT